MENVYTRHEQELIRLTHSYPLDLARIKNLILSAINPNACHDVVGVDGRTIREYFLGEILYNFGYNTVEKKEYGSDHLPEIIDLFLQAGFDPKRDSGQAGAYALSSLMYCLPDENLLRSAKCLMDHGADPRISPEDGDSALELLQNDAAFRESESLTHEAKVLFRLTEFIRSYLTKKNYAPLEYEFIQAVHEDPLDFPWLESRLQQGVQVNASYRSVNPKGLIFQDYLLTDVLYDFGWHPPSIDCYHGYGCRNLPRLLTLLFEYGLDLTRDEHRVGARALVTLSSCKFDEHVLEALQILLDHGADPDCAVYPYPSQTFFEYLKTKTDAQNELTDVFDERYELMLNVVLEAKDEEKRIPA